MNILEIQSESQDIANPISVIDLVCNLIFNNLIKFKAQSTIYK